MIGGLSLEVRFPLRQLYAVVSIPWRCSCDWARFCGIPLRDKSRCFFVVAQSFAPPMWWMATCGTRMPWKTLGDPDLNSHKTLVALWVIQGFQGITAHLHKYVRYIILHVPIGSMQKHWEALALPFGRRVRWAVAQLGVKKITSDWLSWSQLHGISKTPTLELPLLLGTWPVGSWHSRSLHLLQDHPPWHLDQWRAQIKP